MSIIRRNQYKDKQLHIRVSLYIKVMHFYSFTASKPLPIIIQLPIRFLDLII